MKRVYLSEKRGFAFLYIIITALAGIFILNGCAAGDEMQSFRKNRQQEKVFSFYDYRNGDETHWKVYFKEDKISELYRNGIKIPDTEINSYSDIIFDKVDDISSYRREDSRIVRGFGLDRKNFRGDLNKLQSNLRKHQKDIKFKIQSNLKDEMKKLSIEMDKLKDNDVKIFIKPDRLKKEMKELKKNLYKLKKDSADTFIFRFDGEELEKGLKELAENLKSIEIDIDIPAIKIDLNDLDDNLKEINIELEDLDNDIENLKEFFDELKLELVKDNLIETKDDKVSLRLGDNKMYVNEKEVPDHLYKKYNNLYKLHTGSDFKGKNYFRID